MDEKKLDQLGSLIEGELDCSSLARRLYSQDASLYQEMPLGVVRPRSREDCIAIAEFASENGVDLIPRAAGTSLAGQCVGSGLVVDISRHMTSILEIDAEKRQARVQPGVIQDDLNDAVADHGLQFAPDTSTSRQAMIGGMIGNNSCGAHSILHGTTRDHVIEVEAALPDGSIATFTRLNQEELEAKKALESLEGQIYRDVFRLIDKNRDTILAGFPDPEIERRNMGYALDRLARMQPWDPAGEPFSLVPLICGSEGTLCLVTEARLKLVPRPAEKLLVCAHFDAIQEACDAVVVVLGHNPAAVELMDGILLDATRGNREQSANRFWIEGEPGAVLAIEMYGDSGSELQERAEAMCAELESRGLGYAYKYIASGFIQRVWDLRKAALGLLTGMPGDARPVTAIEDTAVAPKDLSHYVEEMHRLMQRNDCECVFYGHAGTGLLHLRPMLNMKTEAGLAKFRSILEETADVLKKFNGSLSGEHGDGRLRARLLERMLDPEVYKLLVETKRIFDADTIMNSGKVVDGPDSSHFLRADPQSETPDIDTVFDWSAQKGMLRAVERCNGAGFCRQSPGRGTMCPSYMATGEEALSTRGRANVMRQLLASNDPDQAWSDPDLAYVLADCLSCKACVTECPSSVDMARLKAEYLQKRRDRGHVKLRDRVFGFYTAGARLAAFAPGLASKAMNLGVVKRLLGIAPQRQIPPFARQTLSAWHRRRNKGRSAPGGKRVVLFNDEFSNFADTDVGQAAVEVLEMLGYEVILTERIQSGRPLISKGFLKAAGRRLVRAVEELYPYTEEGLPIIGIEPSAILGFRDEIPDLVPARLQAKARQVGDACLLFEEFMLQSHRDGKFKGLSLKAPSDKIMLHGHCHQKALAGTSATTEMLRMIPDAEVEEIPGGCCGMAGSFGYEREHYELSMQIGELTLFPAIRENPDAIICAAGTSCRQQIREGTGCIALHPAQIVHDVICV